MPAAKLEHSSVLRKFLLAKGQRRKSCITALGFAFINCTLSCIMFIMPNFSIRMALAYYSRVWFQSYVPSETPLYGLRLLLAVRLGRWTLLPVTEAKHQATPGCLQNISEYRWAEVDFVYHCHKLGLQRPCADLWRFVVQCKAIQMTWILPACATWEPKACSDTAVAFENSSLKLSLKVLPPCGVQQNETELTKIALDSCYRRRQVVNLSKAQRNITNTSSRQPTRPLETSPTTGICPGHSRSDKFR